MRNCAIIHPLHLELETAIIIPLMEVSVKSGEGHITSSMKNLFVERVAVDMFMCGEK